MNQHKQIDFILKTTLVIIAIAPVLYLNQVEKVPFKASILGTGSWGIGLIFKMIAHQIVVIRLNNKSFSPVLVSITNGFLSGFFELAAAAGIIFLMKDKFVFDFKAIISFGLAIGSFESLIVAQYSGGNLLKNTALEKTTEEIEHRLKNLKGMKLIIYHYAFPVIERILATFIHISTRGLIFVSFFGQTIIPVLVALLAFIIADGLLGYYFNISGRLLSDKGFVQVYIALFALTVFVTLIFLSLISPYKNIAL